MNFTKDNVAEYQLDSKYTVRVGIIGFYLQFTQDNGAIIGMTNTVYINVHDNKTNTDTGAGNTSNGGNNTTGKAGVTYTPEVSEEGILSWTNDGGLPNPSPVNIKGTDGSTPYIGENNNWFINGVDTGVSSRGDKGDTGNGGIYLGDEPPTDPNIYVWVNPNGVVENYTLTNEDKREIADIVVSDFDNELLALLGGDSGVTE